MNFFQYCTFKYFIITLTLFKIIINTSYAFSSINEYNINNADDFRSVLEKAGNDRTIEISASIHLYKDLNVPPNVALKFEDNSNIILHDRVNLSINGPIYADLKKIITGNGKITGQPIIETCYPEWFGAKYDTSSKNILESNRKAIQTCLDISDNIHINGFLHINGSAIIYPGTNISGTAHTKSGIISYSRSEPTLRCVNSNKKSATITQNVIVNKLYIVSKFNHAIVSRPYQWSISENLIESPNGHGIHIQGSGYIRENFIVMNHFRNCRYAIFATKSNGKPVDNFILYNNINGGKKQYTGIYWEDGTNCLFQGNHVYGELAGESFSLNDNPIIVPLNTNINNGDVVHLISSGSLPKGLQHKRFYFVTNREEQSFQLSSTAENARLQMPLDFDIGSSIGKHFVVQSGAHMHIVTGPSTKISHNHFPRNATKGHSKLQLLAGNPSTISIDGNSFWGGNGRNNMESLLRVWNLRQGLNQKILFNSNTLEGGENSINILNTNISLSNSFSSAIFEYGTNIANGSYSLSSPILSISLENAFDFPLIVKEENVINWGVDTHFSRYIIYKNSKINGRLVLPSNLISNQKLYLENRAKNVQISIECNGKLVTGKKVLQPAQRVEIQFDVDDNCYYVF